MEMVHIPTESDIKKWIKEALLEYFESRPVGVAKAFSPEEESFLNRKQVAGILGISIVTLHDWMNRGLPFHKQRGRVYFVRAEITEYVTNNPKGFPMTAQGTKISRIPGRPKYQKRVA